MNIDKIDEIFSLYREFQTGNGKSFDYQVSEKKHWYPFTRDGFIIKINVDCLGSKLFEKIVDNPKQVIKHFKSFLKTKYNCSRGDLKDFVVMYVIVCPDAQRNVGTSKFLINNILNTRVKWE